MTKKEKLQQEVITLLYDDDVQSQTFAEYSQFACETFDELVPHLTIEGLKLLKKKLLQIKG
jgi:HKD family nuclease